MRPFTFYQHWLDVVSRSFALCIPQLDPPFRDQVALAYLLLRVLDTVEDAPFADPAVQQRQFERLLGFLRAMPARADVDVFVAAFPAQVSDGERALLGETFALFEDGHGLAEPVRVVMFRAIERMANGMAVYARRPAPLRLVDIEDVARYCCFVAGVVGEMLTRLWSFGRAEAPPSPTLAYQFALFLQKVNILKDQDEDEAAGRFLVPDRSCVLASLRDDGEGALAYLQALPRGDRGYRIFCAWSLMLGAVTVAQLDQHGLKADQPRHIRRAETAQLLARTAAIADDNAALGRQFAELMPLLPEIAGGAAMAKPESFEWFRETLGARLTDEELLRLGIARVTGAALVR